MPLRRAKDLFVIHTKSNPHHQRLHDGLSQAFDKVGLSVWQYPDWTWRDPDRTERDWQFDEDSVELMSEVEREILGVEPPRRVPGNVDRATLQRLIADTRAVLIFDLPESEITAGVEEETKIMDGVSEELLPFGHFALVSFEAEGHFASRYPLHCGAVLELDVSRRAHQETADQLALFTLRVLLRKDMVSRLWLDESSANTVEALRDWMDKSDRLIASCHFVTRLDPDIRIVELLEEILSWIACLLRKMGADNVWKQLPSVANWVESGFNGACRHTDLHEKGLLNLVGVVRSLGSRGAHMLSEIQRRPLYHESAGAHAVSWTAVVESSRALGALQGRTAVESLIETATSAEAPDSMVDILLEGIGRVAEKEDLPARRRAVEFIRNEVEHGSLDASGVEACLSAFGRAAQRSDAPWLRALLALAEVARFSVVIALVRLASEKYVSHADELLRESLRKGSGKRARALLVSGGLELAEWPGVHEARLLLFHPDPDVRAAMAFVVGHQNRQELAGELEMLQRDPSGVTPFLSERATQDIGRTVDEGARQALARMSGRLPAVDTTAW
jgi:hypothetical protein